jgi:hypothetical protein
MMLVGFVGLIGSGKGTAGEILVKKYGFKPDSFAAPVKDAVAALFAWPRHLLEGDTTESRAFREEPDAYWSLVMGRQYTPREALQKMGTEVGRNFYHRDLWVRSLELRVRRATTDVVITDVRFPNEVDAIINQGGRVIVIERGPKPEHYDEALETNRNQKWSGVNQTLAHHSGIHYSEWAWIGYPLLKERIKNDGSVEELEQQLVTALSLQNNTL